MWNGHHAVLLWKLLVTSVSFVSKSIKQNGSSVRTTGQSNEVMLFEKYDWWILTNAELIQSWSLRVWPDSIPRLDAIRAVVSRVLYPVSHGVLPNEFLLEMHSAAQYSRGINCVNSESNRQCERFILKLVRMKSNQRRKKKRPSNGWEHNSNRAVAYHIVPSPLKNTMRTDYANF